MQLNRNCFLACLVTSSLFGLAEGFPADAPDLVVATDGSGDYTKVQDAIDAVPKNKSTRTVIFIKPGRYKEKIRVPADKKNLSLVGESYDTTILTYDDYAGKNSDYASTRILADDFFAQHLTFQNTIDSRSGIQSGQAAALRTDGDRAVFHRCRMDGFQDTYYTGGNKRSYHKECIITGTTDFIYGDGIALFEDCTLLNRKSSHITAHSQKLRDGVPLNKFGYVFKNCQIRRHPDEQIAGATLGRPWGNAARVVYLNCDIDSHIKADGWSEWRGRDNHKTAFYAEYKNRGPGSKPSNRLSWTHQLTDAEAAEYTKENIFRADSTTATELKENWIPTIAETANSTGAVPSFPGAEGYGSTTRGGRGGKVLAVTNLDESGPGSLRAALEAKGPRTVVFKVSGTIDADLRINNDYITVAGQSAPGDGITIKGQLRINANEVVVRYLRVRAEGRDDAVSGRYKKNIILDHVSASWSSDEVMSIYHSENVTIQWCMITEACSRGHKFGGIWGNNYGTYHHNLFAHNTDRNPRIASGAGYNDVRNNVVYNWKNESTYGGEVYQPGNEKFVGCHVNLVANYYKPGPGTPAKNLTRICSPWSRNGAADYGKWYLADNYLVGSPEVTQENWKGVFPQYTGKIPVDLNAIPGLKLDKPSEFMPIYQQTAEAAYEDVLKHAGCSLPNRDAIDARIIDEVRKGTASKGDNGFVDSPDIAGGWPELKTAPAPTDADNDGMPDEWESRYGLDPNNPSDTATDNDGDGYANVEEYLNGTNPTEFVDYTKLGNNINKLEKTNAK